MSTTKRRHVRVGSYVVRSPFKVDGRYVVRARHVVTGHVRKISTRATSRAEAFRVVRSLLEAAPASESPTFSEAAEEYLALKPDLRASTRKEYGYCFFTVYQEALGAIQLDAIRPADVDRLLANPDWAPKTRANHLGNLRALFRWARRRGLVSDDPTEGIRARRTPRRRGRALTYEECRRLLNACPPFSPIHTAILLALYTGLRRGNVLGLRWDWITDNVKIEIPASEFKSDHDHVVPVHPELRTHLEQLSRSEELVLGRRYYDLRKPWIAALREAGLECRFHDLRHTFCSFLTASGAPFPVVKALMGHSLSSEISLRYSHPSWSQLVDGIDRLPTISTLGTTSQPAA